MAGKEGRPPKPANLRLLQGNPGKRPVPDDIPKPETAVPACPDFLEGEAVVEWHRVMEELVKLNLVALVDRAALAMYCSAWGDWVKSREMLSGSSMVVKTKNGHPMHNPWYSIGRDAEQRMWKAIAEFGMTPSSRSRVRATEGMGEQLDLFGEMLMQRAAKKRA